MSASRPPAGFAHALAAMTATQAACVVTLSAVPVMAPELAAAVGVDTGLVGLYTGLCFTAATAMSAGSGALIARYGAVRTNQLALLGSAAALLIALGASVPALALSAVLVGLAYGPNTPSGSQVLAAVTPPHRRGLAFSIKQSGAPLGGMLAGLVLPPVALLAGWQAALGLALALSVLTALAVEPLRRAVDRPLAVPVDGEHPSALRSMRLVLGDPPLRRLTTGGVCLMVAHACFQTFLVAFLVDRVGLGLALAGGLFATLQAAGAVSRVVLGWGVDRLRNARGTLVTVALVALGSSVLVATFDRGWTVTGMAAACLLAGVGSSGWYGVFLAEVARLAPAEGTGTATGGALFFVYGGMVVGPVVGSGLVILTGGYTALFVAVAVLAGVGALAFGRASRER